MAKQITLFLLLLSIIKNPAYGEDVYAIPNWVKPYEAPLEPVPVTASHANFQHLLADLQRNWEEKTLYKHIVYKPLNQAGVATTANYKIEFDPSYQKVVFHAIRVFREGEWSDRLATARHHVLQQESDLDRNLYRGLQTLVYFLNDIRPGDIVEYAYSIIGWNPFFESKYSELFSLQGESPIEKVVLRFLAAPTHNFFIKPFYKAAEPHVAKLPSGLWEWSWEISKMEACASDYNQPNWSNRYFRIQVSEYKDWQEIASKLSTLCSLPEEFEPSPEMKKLVKKWTEATSIPLEQTTLAVRFVQDHIRYLSLGDGIWAIKPAAPNLVLERRFGDCKDKTFLLHTLLHLIGIHSTLILVHSNLGMRLPWILPTPFAFNHVILQIELQNSLFYIDSTIHLQGGPLHDNYFPLYHWGLNLAKDSTSLLPLPSPIQKRLVEIETIITFTSPDFANIMVETKYLGARAETIRRELSKKGLEKLSKEYHRDISTKYRGAVSIFPMAFEDNREKNTLIRKESYRVPVRMYGTKKHLKVIPRTIDDFLDKEITPDRTSPYNLHFPLWVKEHIHIENPFKDWHPESDTHSLKNDCIEYAYSIEKKGQIADFYFELKNLQDHIPIQSIDTYWKTINEIESCLPIEISFE